MERTRKYGSGSDFLRVESYTLYLTTYPSTLRVCSENYIFLAELKYSVGDARKNRVQALKMVSNVRGKDDDIVKIPETGLPFQSSKHPVHHLLKSSRSIAQTEWHDTKFI